MSQAISPSVGLGVIHLFCRVTASYVPDRLVNAVHDAEARGTSVVTVSMLGHKADAAVMALSSDLRELRTLQNAVRAAGLDIVDSYVSLTEVSEYAKGMPEAMLNARLHPVLPPEGMDAWCFYPMSKRREAGRNWFTLDFESRRALMEEHGRTGRTFAGRVVQLVTGSAGLDDHEWGVTLFAVRPDDLKDVVYTMRFDEASAEYAEFGTFYVGMVTPVAELAGRL